MHDASIPEDVTARMTIENKHWRIAPPPGCGQQIRVPADEAIPSDGKRGYPVRAGETVIKVQQERGIFAGGGGGKRD